MYDLISRRAAIEAIGNWLKKAENPLNTSKYNSGEIDAYVTAIETVKLIRAEQRWIPVSERLPEYGVCVLTYTIDDEYQINRIIEEDTEEWLYNYSKIVAWMPLPEPYRESKK